MSGIDLGSLMNPMSLLQGITGGGEQGTQATKGTSSTGGLQSIFDSFKKGDFAGGLESIFSKVGGGGSGSFNVTEMLDPMMFVDPFTKKILEKLKNQGYAEESKSTATASGPTTVGGATLASSNTVTGTPAGNASYDERWANAVNQVQDHFDLLDTASGLGGKDGLIGRCDLEAAIKNPNLPAELRAACKFLLENPAAFNQLDVGAGIGNCDGLIGKCDVEAAKKALPKKSAQPTGATGGSTASSASATSTTGSAQSSSSAKGTEANATGTTSASNSTTSTTSTSSTSKASSNRFEGMTAEEIIEELMYGFDDQIVDKAEALKAAEDARTSAASGSEAEKKANRDIAQLEREMQKLLEKRQQMYSLLSTFSKIENEMASTAISNMGRI